MVWAPTKPATSTDLLSAEVRDNFGALDTALMAPVIAAPQHALLKVDAADVITGIAPGTNGHVLTMTAGVPGWSALPADVGFANPMTTAGDVIVGGASGAATRLAAVATGAVLASAGTSTAPTWNTSPTLTRLTLSQATDCYHIMQSTGGHDYRLICSGTGSALAVGSWTLFDQTLTRSLLQFNASSDLYAYISWISAFRRIVAGAADTGGAGYRTLLIAN